MHQSKLIGNKAFYRRVMAVAGPLLIQNVITNFVNLLDNIMVGQVGTEAMSGVAIVNQLMFIFNLCIFGGLAGPGIFSAQFYGNEDLEGVRNTFRMKFYIAFSAVVVFASVFLTAGGQLISQFLHEGQDALDLEATLHFGRSYMLVILLQMIPFAIMQCYASTLREGGETLLPMKAGIIAVFVNLCFNYLLIFGKLGFPELGVVGAAIATVIARIVECAIVVVWTHRHKEKNPFIANVYHTMRVPRPLIKKVAVMGLPLLANEVLWSCGMTMLNQSYSIRGLEVVSATNIASTVSNLFFCAFFALGNSVSILIGQLLGAGELERAVDEDRKIIAFSVVVNIFVGILMAILAPLFPKIYNTTDMVKDLASRMIMVSAAMMPFNAFTHCAYFTLRSGGKTVITFLFDCGSIWCLSVPLAFCLSRFTSMPIIPMYLCVHLIELLKCVIGFILLRTRKWVNNLVKQPLSESDNT